MFEILNTIKFDNKVVFKSNKVIYNIEEWTIKIIASQLTNQSLINNINFSDWSNQSDLHIDVKSHFKIKKNNELITCKK